jgi:ATP-binding cassette, subfamily B, bacterial PglK
MLLAAILEVLSIGLVVPFVSILLDETFFSKNVFIQEYLPDLLNYSQSNLIQISLIIFLTIFTVKLLFMNFLVFKKNDFLFGFGHKISEKLFKSYATRKYEFHLRNNSSKIINNLQNEISSFSLNVLLSLLEIATEILIFSGLFLLLIFIDPLGCLVLGGTSLLFIFIFRLVTKKKTHFWAAEKQKMDTLAIKQIQQGIGGIREVLLMLKEKLFISLFSKYMKKSSLIGSKSQSLIDIPRHYMEFLALTLFVTFIFFSLIREVELISIIPTLGVFSAVAFKLLPAVNRISSSLVRIGYSKVIVETIYNEIEYYNNEGQLLFKKIDEKFDIPNLNKEIELKNISFKYPSSKKKILDNVSIKIFKNDTIGIIGESGEGKTTLINLLIGLLKPVSGEILLDSKNINYNNRGWLSIIGYIPQNPFMLDDNIYNNISFEPGNDGEDFKKYDQCLKESQLYDFVNSLEHKSKTNIGEKGTRLSGGQIQRLSIARALYRNPKILILDEATSSLDFENEEKIIKTINSIKKDKTIIIVSHKPSALKYCDKVFRLESGNLIKLN